MEKDGRSMRGFPNEQGSTTMKQPDEVAAIMALKRLGVGNKTIAKRLGMSKTTVRRYVAVEGWVEYQKPDRASALEGHKEWLSEQMRKHRNNAEVVRQELAREKEIHVSLRTVERAVQGHRALARAEIEATTRFETGPGEQGQIDFGERTVTIAGQSVTVYFFVMTLGYSRRNYVRAFNHERVDAWFSGLEGAFQHFGGVTREILLDNPRALVSSHNVKTREVKFTDRFNAFAKHWGFTPRACTPYRARTKGKDERGVGYVKKNAIAGREFESWASLEAHLAWWMREIADTRIHGTTEERPIDRFERERASLRPAAGIPPFVQVREMVRVVHSDLCVEVDTNSYSVPWEHIGKEVLVRVRGGVVVVSYSGVEIARHAELSGRKERSLNSRHYLGLALPGAPTAAKGEFSRPLSEYAAVAEAF